LQDYQGKGIGTKVLTDIMTRSGKQRGWTTSFKINERVKKLYDRL